MEESNQESNLVAAEANIIDVRQIVSILWSGKRVLLATTAFFAVSSALVALSLPDVYRAEALLAPNENENNGLSALASQYGGIASLAGINFSAGSADKISLGLQILRSRKFLSNFMERRNLIVPLMASEGWSATDNKLQIDPEIYDINAERWIREVDPPRKPKPSVQEMYEEFTDNLYIVHDEKSGFVSIAYEHYSPFVAQQWVEWLVADINSTMLETEVSEAEKAIDFLNGQIELTSITDLKSVFYNLIEEQTKTIMLASVNDEYLLRTIDPAVVPELKAGPKRALLVLAATLLGFIFSAAVLLGWQSKS